jgi:hypothetical protein
MGIQKGHYLMLRVTKNNVLQQIDHKVKVWETIEAITNVLNHVATTCMMNQSEGHWLLSNALTTPTPNSLHGTYI